MVGHRNSQIVRVTTTTQAVDVDEHGPNEDGSNVGVIVFVIVAVVIAVVIVVVVSTVLAIRHKNSQAIGNG